MISSRRLLIASLILAVAATAMPSASPAQLPASTATRTVRVSAAALAPLAALELTPRLDLDYGSYRWLELDAAGFSTLAASGVPFTEVPAAGEVQVTRYRFDPLAEGEPTLPFGLADSEGEGPALRLVQLVAPATDAWLTRLRSQGTPPLQYYPENAFLVWADAAQAAALDALDFVRWQGLFHPAYKINRDLDGRSGPVGNVSLFFYNDGADAGDDGAVARSIDEIQRLGGEILMQHPAQPDGVFQIAVARLDAAAVDAAARIANVVWLGYRSPELQLDDEMSAQIVAGNHPGGTPVVGYEAHLASLGIDGSGVTWAITDTGVDFDHPELGSRIVGGWSGAGACAPPGGDCPSGGHGTHVAGIAMGDGSSGIDAGDGFLCGLGMAPAASIFAMNVFFGSDPLQEYSKQAVLGGAVGSNNSWTTGEGTCHGYQDSERTYDIMVRDGNFDTDFAEPQIIVFSAGNSGPGSCTLTAPKEAKNVIVTAGTRNFRTSSDIDAMYTSSSRGPMADGRLGPTIATPGQTIYSTRNDTGGSCAGSDICGGGLHASCTGTSMAAPHTSGAIVLLTEWWRGTNGGDDPSPAMAKALLINNGVDMSSVSFPTPTIPNADEGWGRLNVTDVVAPGAATAYYDQETTFDGAGETWTLTVGIADPAQPLKISLTWSDAPGAVGANPALVNDLDLEVDEDGTTYLGNNFADGWSQAGGSADVLNNQENVFIESPGGTSATIRVRATTVNGDGVPFAGDATDQDFALVCFNCEVTSIFADGFESGDVSAWSSSTP